MNITNAINNWDPVDGPQDWPKERFSELALALFAHQYRHNEPYRSLCDRRGVTPDTSPTVETIPAVPTDAFKEVSLLCGNDPPAHTFRTSGSTGDRRGEHHFYTLHVYRSSLHPTFQRFCNPGGQSLRMLVVAPSSKDLPDSSLSFMLGELLERNGDDKSDFFVTVDENGQWNFDAAGLAEALDDACAEGVTTLLFGTAFGFAEFFERAQRSWRLPRNSRLVETGGFKGRIRHISRDDLYRLFTERLGLPQSRCLSEYSMTELSSQAYTDQFVAGDSATGRFYTPPWLRVDIVDPLTLEPLPHRNAPGLIRFFDLANVDSVSAIQTSDRGILHDDGGLELLGRAPDSDLRGCSLTIEEIVDGA